MRTEFLRISVLRLASGPGVKLSGRKCALTPTPHPVVYSTDRSKVLFVLFFVALCFIYSTMRLVLSLALCFFCSCSFQSF